LKTEPTRVADAFPPRRDPGTEDYARLKRLIAGRGLLERQPRRYLLPAVALILELALVTTGLLLTRGSWWALAWSAPAAFLFGQIGFLGHDAIHNQVLKTSRKNYGLGLALFNLCLGGSRGWWADKHNVHHAQPNRIGIDPDITGGVIAVSACQAIESRGLTRFIMRHQAGIIGPLLSLMVVQIHKDSAVFLSRRAVRNIGAEVGLLLAHYVGYIGGLIMLLGVGRGLLFVVAHQLLLGLYLGGTFLPNHTGMAVLQRGEEMGFLPRQVLTARNIRASRLSDYIFGALSCQIEHHLFPAMPRYRLREAAPIVRQFCEERGIAYRETGVLQAYVDVYVHLKTVALSLRRSVTLRRMVQD
jgi:fatty acid desaturase